MISWAFISAAEIEKACYLTAAGLHEGATSSQEHREARKKVVVSGERPGPSTTWLVSEITGLRFGSLLRPKERRDVHRLVLWSKVDHTSWHMARMNFQSWSLTPLLRLEEQGHRENTKQNVLEGTLYKSAWWLAN